MQELKKHQTNCASWQARKWWNSKCCWFQPCSPSSFPRSSRGISARSWSLSTGCHGGWMWVSNSLCPHFKIPPLLHSISASSSSFSSTSPNGWQSPGLMCPLLCRHGAKMQTHCETSLKVLIWVRLTRASRLFTRKDIAIQFPGVTLPGTFIGFLGCVYFLFRRWWQPREKVKVFVSVCMSPCHKWLTCALSVRGL